jgi:hypothetical protein
MTLAQRARYAAFLAIAAGALVSLLLMVGSADAIAILPRGASDLALSPSLMVVAYIAAFLIAPWLAHRLPIKRW